MEMLKKEKKIKTRFRVWKVRLWIDASLNCGMWDNKDLENRCEYFDFIAARWLIFERWVESEQLS